MENKDIVLFADMKKRKSELDAESKKLGAQIKELEDQIVTHFEQEGMQSIKLDGVGTVYMSRKAQAKAKDGDTLSLVEGLERAGFGSLKTVNHNTFGSFVREQIEAYKASHPKEAGKSYSEMHEALPEEIRDLVELSERVTIGIRRS